MFVVVLTLAWWIAKLDGKADEGELALAVDDVKWVISAMMVANKAVTTDHDKASSARKRTAGDDNSDEVMEGQEAVKKR